jgi:hypothetical protein
MEDTQKQINTDVRDDIKQLYDHAKVANEEMGKVQIHLSALETDMSWVKNTIEKVDARTWIILSGIIVGIAVQIIFYLAKK